MKHIRYHNFWEKIRLYYTQLILLSDLGTLRDTRKRERRKNLHSRLRTRKDNEKKMEVRRMEDINVNRSFNAGSGILWIPEVRYRMVENPLLLLKGVCFTHRWRYIFSFGNFPFDNIGFLRLEYFINFKSFRISPRWVCVFYLGTFLNK